ncbi:MAG: hypothetical protein U0793_00365 [Gemmataceae bacterium]
MNLDKVRANAAAATTEDLLNRVTFYRAGMEPDALEIIEGELRRRGVSEEEIARWGPKEGEPYVFLDDGTVAPCSFCRRPAVESGWSWHRLWGWIPIFPRVFRYCAEHGGRKMQNAE